MLETIGFSNLITKKEISNNLNLLFPKLEFSITEYDSIDKIELKANEIAYILHKTKSEYPIRIEILFQIEKNTEEREQYIAKSLANNLNCKTIVGYQEKYSVNPYLNLVFENEKVFLADDMETTYSNEGERKIKIIKELNYKINWQFDEYGNIVEKEDITQK